MFIQTDAIENVCFYFYTKHEQNWKIKRLLTLEFAKSISRSCDLILHASPASFRAWVIANVNVLEDKLCHIYAGKTISSETQWRRKFWLRNRLEAARLYLSVTKRQNIFDMKSHSMFVILSALTLTIINLPGKTADFSKKVTADSIMLISKP